MTRNEEDDESTSLLASGRPLGLVTDIRGSVSRRDSDGDDFVAMAAENELAGERAKPVRAVAYRLQQVLLSVPPMGWQLLGEFWGAFVLVFVIVMVNCTATLADAAMGQWEIAISQGLGVSAAIYLSAAVSEAHLNPAVTLAIALFRRSSYGLLRFCFYPVAQLLGAFTAAAVAYGFWAPAIALYEAEAGIVRGQRDSERTASLFACYYPSPGVAAWRGTDLSVVSTANAFFCEFVGTFLLMAAIMALTDRRGRHYVSPRTAPLLIGLTVAVLITLFGAHSMAGLNPVRDFGPRLLAYCAGWGRVAIPGPHNGFWLYIVGPLLGAPAGALFYSLLFFYPHHGQH